MEQNYRFSVKDIASRAGLSEGSVQAFMPEKDLCKNQLVINGTCNHLNSFYLSADKKKKKKKQEERKTKRDNLRSNCNKRAFTNTQSSDKSNKFQTD